MTRQYKVAEVACYRQRGATDGMRRPPHIYIYIYTSMYICTHTHTGSVHPTSVLELTKLEVDGVIDESLAFYSDGISSLHPSSGSSRTSRSSPLHHRFLNLCYRGHRRRRWKPAQRWLAQLQIKMLCSINECKASYQGGGSRYTCTHARTWQADLLQTGFRGVPTPHQSSNA